MQIKEINCEEKQASLVLSRVGVRETIIRHSDNIGLTKYWAEDVVTAWNMTHADWLEDSGEVTVKTSKMLESFCDFIKANESLPLKTIAKKYCLENSVPFITEDKKKVDLKLQDSWEKFISEKEEKQ